jgi:hypothetical protein
LLLFYGRDSITPGRENNFFIGLAGHEMSNLSFPNPRCLTLLELAIP